MLLFCFFVVYPSFFLVPVLIKQTSHLFIIVIPLRLVSSRVLVLSSQNRPRIQRKRCTFRRPTTIRLVWSRGKNGQRDVQLHFRFVPLCFFSDTCKVPLGCFAFAFLVHQRHSFFTSFMLHMPSCSDQNAFYIGWTLSASFFHAPLSSAPRSASTFANALANS